MTRRNRLFRPAAYVSLTVVMAAAVSACTGGTDRAATPEATASSLTASTTPATPMDSTVSATTSAPAPITSDKSLWDVVSDVEQRVPITTDTFGQLISQTLRPAGENSWESDGTTQFTDDIQAFGSEYRGNPDGTGTIASIYIQGRCVGAQEVKTRYPDVRITQSPRGPGEGPPLTWSADRPWGTIHFSFKQDPECLHSVIYRTGQ
jgi:hypothetical protein